MRGLIKAVSMACCIAVMASAAARGQEQKKESAPRKERGSNLYLMDFNKFISYGFYLSAMPQAAQFRGGWGALLGQRAALVVDHIFSIGAAYEISLQADRGSIAGKGSSADRLGRTLSPVSSGVKILYGGGYIAYHIFSDQIVNFSLSALAGWGHLGRDYARGAGATFFIVEPELYVFVNLPAHARIGMGTSYRISWGAVYAGIKDRDFRGFSIGLQAQAGIL